MVIRVVFSKQERERAYLVAQQRREFHIEAGTMVSYKRPKDHHGLWDEDVIGAQGEMAVAKFTGLYWDATPVNYQTDPDVGGLIDVRAIYQRNTDRLMIHKGKHTSGPGAGRDRDPDDRPFVLALVFPKYVDLLGWVYGREGKREEWWIDPGTGRPAYFVPRDPQVMRPMIELLDWVLLNPPPPMPGILGTIEERQSA